MGDLYKRSAILFPGLKNPEKVFVFLWKNEKTVL